MSQINKNICTFFKAMYISFGGALMRKVDLRMNELHKYNTIKDLVHGKITKERAEIELGLKRRQIDRLINVYLTYGKIGFIHGNRNRKPVTAFSEEFKDQIADLYITKYFDCSYTLFAELLHERENINISIDEARKILLERDILSPKSHKSTKRAVKQKLKEQLKNTKAKKEITKIQSKIVEIENAHPTLPRCAFFGEEIQMDASQHCWFGKQKAQLHAAIDDSTGMIVGAYFDTQETLNGYYNITSQMLHKFGIPYKIKTDNRTVFEYKKKGIISDENDTFTQYSYAAKQLGINIETSSTPEFKARIERLFGTLQNRFIVYLRLANVTSLEEANAILPSLVEKYNKQFALQPNNTKNVFEKQISDEKINLTLAVLSRRVVDSGHAIKFKKKYYRFVNSRGIPIFFSKHTKCMVIEAFDKKLYATVDESIFSLEEIPEFQYISENFETIEKSEIKYVYIPKMIHPWKEKSFTSFIEKQQKKIALENELVLAEN